MSACPTCGGRGTVDTSIYARNVTIQEAVG